MDCFSFIESVFCLRILPHIYIYIYSVLNSEVLFIFFTPVKLASVVTKLVI